MSVRLTLILSGKAYEEHEFKTFTRIRVGRSEDCDVRIDNLGISRYSCEIVNLGGSYQLRKLGRAKVLINGTPVTNLNLNDGDAISIGKFTIAFAADEAWNTVVGPGSEIMGEGTMADTGAVSRGRQASLVHAVGYLCRGEKDEETNREVLSRAFFTLGKDEDSDIVLGGWGAPRMAAIIVREGQGFRIMDLSPKGDALTLNGQPCLDSRLSDSDTFVVRGQTLRFFSGNPGDPR